MPHSKTSKGEGYKKTVFPNGLTLVTERFPGTNGLSIGYWVKAGTRHERSTEQGVSHFLEHMLFKGTDLRTSKEIAVDIEKRGGEFNAFTGREYTCFHLLILDRDLDLGIEILNDVLLNSKFDAEELERERKVIQQEIAMLEETPDELVQDIFFELVYPRHGLGRNILGTETSVRRMRRGDLIRYFRKHYVPSQIVVAVSGDVSHKTVRQKLGRLARLRNWPGRAEKKPSKRELGFEPAPPMRKGTWWVPRATEQVHLVWGVEGPKYASRDRMAAFLLNVWLGGGMSSELFQEIREKRGMAYSVYSSLQLFHDSGLFTIYAATSMKHVPLCLKLIEEISAKLKQELMREEDLTAIKDNVKGNVLLATDDSENRMTALGRNEIFFGRYHTSEEVCALIDAVTPHDIRRVARKLLRGPASVVCLGPKPSRSVKNKLRPKVLTRR